MLGEVSEDVLRRWREETPLVTAGRIHLNNAGASARPRRVVDRMREHLRLECELGGYEAADLPARLLRTAVPAVAQAAVVAEGAQQTREATLEQMSRSSGVGGPTGAS